ncbi:MAG TPA: amino acid dehydrogenase, partial [Planctomycetaceae bacterium]|nr:amino acid dehydrogenase [Planctomycetaceae bacterium]
LEQTAMKSFAGGNGRAVAVETTGETLTADNFVVAVGAWAPLLQQSLGVKLPIQPGKGYSITMARPKLCPKYPMILEECHVAITPFEEGYRVGSTMEFSGYDTSLNRARLNYLRSGAAEYLHEPTAEPVEEEWYGWRPMTADGIPYIDRSPRFGNVWIAAGHSMLGISMGTGTGKLVAELITGAKPHVDPTLYRIGR